MELGPEAQRLADRLFGDPDPERRAKHISVSWGPKAGEMTGEERAAMINAALDDLEAGRAREIDLDY